jgi:hypothetical protein
MQHFETKVLKSSNNGITLKHRVNGFLLSTSPYNEIISSYNYFTFVILRFPGSSHIFFTHFSLTILSYVTIVHCLQKDDDIGTILVI